MKKSDIAKRARECCEEAYSADLENRERALDDLRFVVGDQWPDEVRKARETEGKPCLTINGLPQYVRQVTGQLRSMNPAVKVSASDQNGSDEVAEIYEGLIRSIEQKCDAASVYEGAAESAAQGSIGWFRVRSDYVSPTSFDQELLIERIYNQFAVFCDPLAKHPSRMDARYILIAEEMPREDFEEEYPDASTDDITTENAPEGYSWITADTITIAEYYWREFEEYKIGMLPDGSVVRDPKPPEMFTKERTVRRPVVKWAKVTAHDVLEGPTEIPCEYIPVFAVTGEEIHIGEEVYRSSVVRYAKDPQMLYNFARSANAEVTALQPKAPYLVTAKQVQGLEAFWNEANNSNRPYLPYNPDEKAPAPQRSQPPVSSQGLMTEIQLSAEDMKRTTGIYDAALGARSNETSGVAIEARKQEAQNSTSVYADNMVKAIMQCGRVLVSMIPKIYDTKRVIRTLGEDGQEKQVLINQIIVSQDGIVPVNDLSQGMYDVRVSVGPAYSTKRDEARDGMLEFLRIVPNAAAVTSDLVAASQEWPNADQFAERLKKTLPPGVIGAEDLPPEQKQQAAQAQQAQQAMQQDEMRMVREMKALEIRKANAEAVEAEADARKAQAEALEAEAKIRMVIQQPAGMNGVY